MSEKIKELQKRMVEQEIVAGIVFRCPLSAFKQVHDFLESSSDCRIVYSIISTDQRAKMLLHCTSKVTVIDGPQKSSRR